VDNIPAETKKHAAFKRGCGQRSLNNAGIEEISKVQTDLANGGDVVDQSQSALGAVKKDIDAIAEEDVLRAQVYGLLSRVLAEPMSDETLEIVRGLSTVEDASDFGAAMKAFGGMAVRTTRGKAEEEYSALFHGMGSGGEIHPYSSYYLTGFIYEKPLADLRRDLSELGVKRSGHSQEPEDHIAFLCEIMHGLITGAFGGPASLTRQREFFNRHMATWAVKVFEDLESAKSAALYMPVGTLGKLFVTVEAEAFGMVAA
jgi:TorA maturation chaperone TorD